MSTSVVLAALLGLFSLNQASLPDCKELITPRTLEDDNKSIMGKWIFLEGIADHHLFTDILKTVNSSWMEFGPSTLAKTLTLSQGDMLESNRTESDMDTYWKQAECLGFKRETQYSYDGVTGQFGFQCL
uniref:Uncharacterized protein n=1 Tax=Cyprinus carpio TaxID=7962 RepID=A0A8C1F8X2_CYPCA